MRLVAAVHELRQHDRQLAILDRRTRARDVERAVEAYGAGEAAELAFDQMKGLILARARRCLLADDEQHPCAEEDAQRSAGNTADVDHDFNRFIRLENVERRMALS